jgi:hypothetical protein
VPWVNRDLADDRDILLHRSKSLSKQLVHDRRPVVLRGIDVIHTSLHSRSYHPYRLLTVRRRTDQPEPGELHSPIPDPRHRSRTKG